MSLTTLRIKRLDDDDILIIEPSAFIYQFFRNARVREFENVAGKTRAAAITGRDVEILNSLMGARTPYALWSAGRPVRWLQRIDPSLDLIASSNRAWKQVDGTGLVYNAVAACLGPGRNIAVATK